MERRFAPHCVFGGLVAVALGLAVLVAWATPLPNGSNEFNSAGFIVEHAWVKFAYLGTMPARRDLSRNEEDSLLVRYFLWNGDIAEAARTAGDPASDEATVAAARNVEALGRRDRAAIENTVERILEGRLTQVIREAGLTRRVGSDIVWPPVNIEFQAPPQVLITSPRSEIRKKDERLLSADLTSERVQEIESAAERDGRTSALVVEIGGIAMYPAIIPEGSDYRFVMQDIAHEWLHQYLYFSPLGRKYFASGKLTTLNETVANIVGTELGDRVAQEYPLQAAAAPSGGGRLAAPPPQAFDYTAEMRALRVQVEALLAAGRIDDAEALMEAKRRQFVANKYYIRRLNQAYFAFYGSYADSAGSIDPIGPKLQTLRADSPTLREFVLRARALTSEGALDEALATQPR